MNDLKDLIKQFMPFAQEQMGFNRPPKLFLRQDATNGADPLGKTGFYDPQAESITIYVSNRHPKDILRSLSHELVHIREKHSLDLLYFELLRILCWFNPLVYIYQKRISEVHEYIADAIIVKGKNKSDYYEKLLAEVFQTQQFSFTNQFFKLF